MRELDRRIGTLKLRLAEIGAREEQVRSLQRQFRGQLERLMDFAIYDHGDLGSALSMADEVDSRLRHTEMTLRHLETIRVRGQEELNALLLTRSVEGAKSDVADLEAQLRDLDAEIERIRETRVAEEVGRPPSDGGKLDDLLTRHDQIGAEIRRLRGVISEASEEAARAVSERASRRAS